MPQDLSEGAMALLAALYVPTPQAVFDALVERWLWHAVIDENQRMMGLGRHAFQRRL